MNQTRSKALTSYLVGFLLSILLTLAAYFLVWEKVFEPRILVFVISSFGIVQMFVQVVFFLHLGQESKPYWNSQLFLFMLIILAIVVIGSLWIMHHLSYNVMPTMET